MAPIIPAPTNVIDLSAYRQLVDLLFHDLRRTFARWSVQRDASLQEVLAARSPVSEVRVNPPQRIGRKPEKLLMV